MYAFPTNKSFNYVNFGELEINIKKYLPTSTKL